MCENDVAFVSFLWSITVKTNPERNRSQWTTMAVVGFYSFLVCLSVNVCVSVLQILLILWGPTVAIGGCVIPTKKTKTKKKTQPKNPKQIPII